MRILTVCDTCGIGGQQRVATNFAMAYAQRGHVSAYLAYRDGGVRGDELTEAGIELWIGGDQIDAALGHAVDFSPDIVHIHRTGHTHSTETRIMQTLSEAGAKIMEQNVFSRVDRSPGGQLIDVHFHLSDWCLWRWKKRGGVLTSDRLGVVIPNGSDSQRFQPVDTAEVLAYRRDVLGVGPGAFVCGRVGQPSYAKWHDSMVSAFAEVARDEADVHLAVIGAPPEIERQLDSLDADLVRRVHKVPMSSEDQQLSRFYSSLDVFLHSAQIGESFGLVLVESMYCETPVITLSRPHKDNSQISVVRHERDGLVAASAAAMPEALRRMHDDPGLRERLRDGLRQRAFERFDRDVVADRALLVAEALLAHPDPNDLRRVLKDVPGLMPAISDAEQRHVLRHAVGRPNPLELLKMRLVHQPIISKLLDAYLAWRYLP